MHGLRSQSRKTLTQLKKESKHIDITIRIGKNGLSEATIAEIAKQLKARKMVKIKFLQSSLEGKDRDILAHAILNQSKSILIEKIGSILVIASPGIVKYKN